MGCAFDAVSFDAVAFDVCGAVPPALPSVIAGGFVIHDYFRKKPDDDLAIVLATLLLDDD